MSDDAKTTDFRRGEILLYDGEWETQRVIYDGDTDRLGRVLVSPASDPDDGWFDKLSDLRRPTDAE